MVNNSELIERLRETAEMAEHLPYKPKIFTESADALKAADKRVTELEEQLSECAYQVENEFKRANFAEAKNKRLDAALDTCVKLYNSADAVNEPAEVTAMRMFNMCRKARAGND